MSTSLLAVGAVGAYAFIAVQPGYDAPEQPEYDAPVQPGYDAPVQPGYDAPVQPGNAAPEAPAAGTPENVSQAVLLDEVSDGGLSEPGALDEVLVELDLPEPDLPLVAMTEPLDLDPSVPYVVGATWEGSDEVIVDARMKVGDEWQPWERVGEDTWGEAEGDLNNHGTEAYIAANAIALQFRASSDSGVPPELTVHVFSSELVESSGDATEAAGSGGNATQATTTYGALSVSLFPAAIAPVDNPMPAIHYREEWNARLPSGEFDIGTVEGVIIHHTAGTNYYDLEDVPAILRAIQNYHMDARGWFDTGYNFLIDRFGRVWEGRAGGVENTTRGVHANSFNRFTTGVSIMGNFDLVQPSTASLNALQDLLAWKLTLHGVSADGYMYNFLHEDYFPAIFTHKQVPEANTSCPGQYLYARLSSIRSSIIARQALPALSLDVDVTGDGIADVASLTDEVITVYTLGTAWEESSAEQLSLIDTGLALDAPGATQAAIVGDVDGNGLADLITVDASGLLWLHLSEGTAFSDPIEIQNPDEEFADWAGYSSVAGAGDINFDGRPDLVAIEADGDVVVFPWSTTDPSELQFVRVVARDYIDYRALGVGSWGPDRISDLLLVGPTGDMVLLEGKGLTGAVVVGEISTGWDSSTELAAVGVGISGGESGVIAYDPATVTFEYYSWSPESEWTLIGNPLRLIESRYQELGGASGVLGAADGPVSACTVDSSECLRTYEHGLIYWTQEDGVFVASGSIGQYVVANLELTGLPVSDEQNIVDPNGDGQAQRFEHGWVHAGPTGAFWSPTILMPTYNDEGGVRGTLGWPTSEFTCGGPANRCIQFFAGGAISGPAAGPMEVLPAGFASLYQSLGGVTGSLGYPVGPTASVTDPHGNGFVQRFEHGWIHSSAAGTFATSNALMTAYSAQGWLRGPLGWPTGAETCTAAGCEQQFAGGLLYAPVGAPAFVVPTISNADISTLYQSLGGMTGSLGYPVGPTASVTDPHGNGFVQRFEHGWIHSSARGTFSLSNTVMAEYSRQGWLRGWLGWPTGACVGSPCTQEFAGGTIAMTANGTARVVPAVSNPDISTLYQSLGGMTGSLGYPVGPTASVTDPHGNGFVQHFEHGWIHSSAAGTFTTSNALMTVYSAQGWLRGPLGWPAGTEVCDAGGCVQAFQYGTIDTH